MQTFESSFSMFYIGYFLVLLCLLLLLRHAIHTRHTLSAMTNKSKNASTTPIQADSSFVNFQRKYLFVYFIMIAADWLQGAHIYALYSTYNFTMQQIGVLFCIGFISSMISGTVIGSIADIYGRKRCCIYYGILYSLSCITKHSSSFGILVVGRILGGISTSILFSCFESWLVSHYTQQFSANRSDDSLAQIFSLATTGNGIIAILSGVLSSLLADNFGPVAPFDASLVCLIFGTIFLSFLWEENTNIKQLQNNSLSFKSPSANQSFFQSLQNVYSLFSAAVEICINDSKIRLVGCIQCGFESAMYIFVFMWTPALTSTLVVSPTGNPEDIALPHGWIFASFMISMVIGSHLFELFFNSTSQEIEADDRTTSNNDIINAAQYFFVIAAICLFLPTYVNNHTCRLVAFCCFEVCVGFYWPYINILRTKYVPDDVRATVVNVFRVPLNFIVVIVLYDLHSLSESQVFIIASVVIFVVSVAQFRLYMLTYEDTKKIDEISVEKKPFIKPSSPSVKLSPILEDKSPSDPSRSPSGYIDSLA